MALVRLLTFTVSREGFDEMLQGQVHHLIQEEQARLQWADGCAGFRWGYSLEGDGTVQVLVETRWNSSAALEEEAMAPESLERRLQQRPHLLAEPPQAGTYRLLGEV